MTIWWLALILAALGVVLVIIWLVVRRPKKIGRAHV